MPGCQDPKTVLPIAKLEMSGGFLNATHLVPSVPYLMCCPCYAWGGSGHGTHMDTPVSTVPPFPANCHTELSLAPCTSQPQSLLAPSAAPIAGWLASRLTHHHRHPCNTKRNECKSLNGIASLSFITYCDVMWCALAQVRAPASSTFISSCEFLLIAYCWCLDA